MQLYNTYIALTCEQMDVMKKLGSLYKFPISKIFRRSGASCRVGAVNTPGGRKFIYNLSPAQERNLHAFLYGIFCKLEHMDDISIEECTKRMFEMMKQKDEIVDVDQDYLEYILEHEDVLESIKHLRRLCITAMY